MALLSGVRVIDFSKWLPGQFCGMNMGDYGADVIKIEGPLGDATRAFFPAREESMSYWHLLLNRNKRSIAIDIKDEADKAILLKLLETADVFLEGFRPGYLKRYGLDYESLKKINPRLIYVSITGFGENSHSPAHDLNIIGLAGLNSLDSGNNACVSEIQISALSASLYALSSISMALYAREKTLLGTHINVGLFDVALSLQTTLFSTLWGCSEENTPRFNRVTHYYNIYKTKDDRFLTVGTMEKKFWCRFCELIERSDLAPRQHDFANEKELIDIVSASVAEKTLAEWEELLNGEEICVTPVRTFAEALDSNLAKAANVVTSVPSDMGELKYMMNPVKIEDNPPTVRMRAPRLNEHREEILSELYPPNETHFK